MGFSIYLTFPLVVSRSMGHNKTKLLNAIAIGILIFLIGDVFLDAAQSLYNGTLYGYGTSPAYDAIFTGAMAVGFLALLLAGHRRKISLTPTQLSLIIALGIGFQNLTEGLLFGALGASIGFTGVTLAVLVGFILQNLTEGFPIAAPFAGPSGAARPIGVIAGALAVGGVPTVMGGAVGFYLNATAFDMVFYGLAVGTMLYVILPMLRNLLTGADAARTSVAYAGVFVGFVIGFLVNLM
jgi:ZIP family zinc transporter